MKAKIINRNKEREDAEREVQIECQRRRELLNQIKVEKPKGFDDIFISNQSIKAVKYWRFLDHVLNALSFGLWESRDINDGNLYIRSLSHMRYREVFYYLSYNNYEEKDEIIIYKEEVWENNKEFLTNNFKEVVLDF